MKSVNQLRFCDWLIKRQTEKSYDVFMKKFELKPIHEYESETRIPEELQ